MSFKPTETQVDIDKMLHTLSDLNDSISSLDVDDELKEDAKSLLENTASCFVDMYIKAGVTE